MKKYELAVYIGRFEPFHNGHIQVIEEGLEIAQKVLVLIGSSNTPRTVKNPFTKLERKRMIDVHFNGLNKQGNHSVLMTGLEDQSYDENKWIKSIQDKVSLMAVADENVVLLGFNRDESSYYLNHFPKWHTYFSAEHHHYNEPINGTEIRNAYFDSPAAFFHSHYMDILPQTTITEMVEFAKSDQFKQLKREWQFLEDYKASWEAAPYPPTFVTTDSIVIQSGHVALIRRKYEPGKGLWALPGGFLDAKERIFDGAIRELQEETQIKVPEKVLRGSHTYTQVFDSPHRSERGRTITHAFLFELNDAEKLPKLTPADDADKAEWKSFAEIEAMPLSMYEDHWHMLMHMIYRSKT